MENWLLVGAGLLVVATKTREWFEQRNAPTDEAEAARIAYVKGTISLDEYERRLDLLLDPETERIREAVEEIGGIGPATLAEIATSFETVGQLKRASREELMAVHGVGESGADAIRQRFDG